MYPELLLMPLFWHHYDTLGWASYSYSSRTWRRGLGRELPTDRLKRYINRQYMHRLDALGHGIQLPNLSPILTSWSCPAYVDPSWLILTQESASLILLHRTPPPLERAGWSG